MFCFIDNFQARYYRAWLIEHPLILGLYALFVGTVIVILSAFLWKIITKTIIPDYKKYLAKKEEEAKETYKRQAEIRQRRIEEAYKRQEEILLILQSNPEKAFSSKEIQIELRIEDFRIVLMVLKMLKQRGKVKALTISPVEVRYVYNN